MTLFNWWTSLSAEQQFEISKILLEKGLLALAIAAAGFGFALYQEKAKAFELRRLELEKLTIPRVYALMSKNDEIWLAGKKTMEDLDADLQARWLPWIDSLIANPSKPLADGDLSRTTIKTLECRLQNGATLREHLVANASDNRMRDILAKFVPKSDESQFLTNLFNIYKDPDHPLFSEPRKLLVQSFLLGIFRDLTREERDAFARRAEDFLIEAKNVIPAHKERPLAGINEAISHMKTTVHQFPSALNDDGVKLGFIAIASQLREAISP